MARARRGRLSSIDLLPDEALPHVRTALAALNENRRTQEDIREELNLNLLALGLQPISKSAFNRKALRLASVGRRLAETRAITETLADRLGPGETDELTVMVAETIKTLVFEMLEASEGGRGIDPRGTMELARALQAAVSAQKLSTERRQKVVADIRDRIDKAVDAVEGQMEGAAAPDGQAVLKRIREDIYGIFER